MSNTTWVIIYFSPNTQEWEYIRHVDTNAVIVYSEKEAHEHAEMFRSGGNDTIKAIPMVIPIHTENKGGKK